MIELKSGEVRHDNYILIPKIKARLKGTVTDSVTSEPVEGAVVDLGQFGVEGQVIRTTTNSDGLFVFEELEPGKYFGAIQKEGYEIAYVG